MHAFLEYLRKEWISWAIYLWFMVTAIRLRSRRERERKRTALEADAATWPAVDATAVCAVVPAGLKGFRLRVWAKPADGAKNVAWTREFALKDEADHYARALRGRTVALHMEPYGAESILRWDELKSAAPPYASETQGRLTRGGCRAAQGFRAVAWGGLGLAAADVATFVRNPDFMWHGMCLCELSIALLVLGFLLLPGASMLRFRMAQLPEPASRWQFEGVSRSILMFLIAAAMATWAGVILFAGLSSSSADWVFFALLSAPMFPLFWWSSVVGRAAVRELRPVEVRVESAEVSAGEGDRLRDPLIA